METDWPPKPQSATDRRNVRKVSETRVWPSLRKKLASQRQVNVIAMPGFTFKRFKTLLGDLRGDMATLLLPDVFCGTVLMVSPMVMARGGVTGVLWVTTRPVDKKRNSNLDTTGVLLKEKALAHVIFYKDRQKSTSHYRSH